MSENSFYQNDLKLRCQGWGNYNSPSLWLLVLTCALMVVFYLLNVKAIWDSSILTLILIIVFVVIPSSFIAGIATRSYVVGSMVGNRSSHFRTSYNHLLGEKGGIK